MADRRRSSLKTPEPPTLRACPHGNVTIPSQVVLEYVAGVIEAAPILSKMVRRAADSLTLFNRGATIVIAVRAASFRSVRGLTCVAAVADEIAFWQAEDGSANPDVEILRAVGRRC
jgi:hypothetical protein